MQSARCNQVKHPYCSKTCLQAAQEQNCNVWAVWCVCKCLLLICLVFAALINMMDHHLMPRNSSFVTIFACSLSMDLTHTFSTSLSSDGARKARLLPSGDTCDTHANHGCTARVDSCLLISPVSASEPLHWVRFFQDCQKVSSVVPILAKTPANQVISSDRPGRSSWHICICSCTSEASPCNSKSELLMQKSWLASWSEICCSTHCFRTNFYPNSDLALTARATDACIPAVPDTGRGTPCRLQVRCRRQLS